MVGKAGGPPGLAGRPEPGPGAPGAERAAADLRGRALAQVGLSLPRCLMRWGRLALPRRLALSSGFALLGALALLWAAPAAVAQAPFRLTIVSPEARYPALGEVVFAVVATGDEVPREVRLRVDGEEVAHLTAPPWQTTVSLGEEPREHRFEAEAWAASGVSAADVLITPALRVDEVVDLNLQQVYVAVERDGQRLLDLPRSAFHVLDEGRIQELVTFEGGDVPLTAVLLLDTSLSMHGGRIAAAFRGARAFVERMAPLDEAMVALFSDRLLAATPFQGGPALAATLAEVQPSGGTAVNDHLYYALSLLEERQGRRVVILLSDGVDIESALSMEEVLWRLRRSRALVYWIRLDSGREAGAQRHSQWRDAAGHRRELDRLAEAVELSGGRTVAPGPGGDLEAAFNEIMNELRQQYVLGYYPDDRRHDGSWRRITVRVEEPGVRVRSRAGYIDE